MLFRKKGRLRKESDQQLYQLLEEKKQEWLKAKDIVTRSVEPSEELVVRMNLAETKYLFLLREAKQRKISAMSI
jgi:hypothetical protein